MILDLDVGGVTPSAPRVASGGGDEEELSWTRSRVVPWYPLALSHRRVPGSQRASSTCIHTPHPMHTPRRTVSNSLTLRAPRDSETSTSGDVESRHGRSGGGCGAGVSRYPRT